MKKSVDNDVKNPEQGEARQKGSWKPGRRKRVMGREGLGTEI
jgi:hypothetical protein